MVNGIVDPGPLIKPLLTSGVATYFIKTLASADRVGNIIQDVFAYGYSITGVVTTKMLYNLWFKEMLTDCPCMSEREKAIFRLVCYGRSKAEIAKVMHVSESTIKYHMLKIFEKCEVSAAHELISKAFRRKWLSWIANEKRREAFERNHL